jgi:hypothetical protein
VRQLCSTVRASRTDVRCHGRRGSPGAAVGKTVPAQMWASQSRRRCGRVSPGADVGESVPAQMWASQSRRRCGPVSPGADVRPGGPACIISTAQHAKPKDIGLQRKRESGLIPCLHEALDSKRGQKSPDTTSPSPPQHTHTDTDTDTQKTPRHAQPTHRETPPRRWRRRRRQTLPPCTHSTQEHTTMYTHMVRRLASGDKAPRRYQGYLRNYASCTTTSPSAPS